MSKTSDLNLRSFKQLTLNQFTKKDFLRVLMTKLEIKIASLACLITMITDQSNMRPNVKNVALNRRKD